MSRMSKAGPVGARMGRRFCTALRAISATSCGGSIQPTDPRRSFSSRNGSHQEILTDDPALNWSNSWASDNRRIAYASYRDGVWNLYSIDRMTRERKQITQYTAYGTFVRNPAWRPGTEEVVYEYSQVKG